MPKQLKPVTDAEQAIAILKRNASTAVIPNDDPFSSLDKGNAFVSIFPDMEAIEEKIEQDFATPMTVLDLPLRLIPKFISDSFLGILNDALAGDYEDILFRDDRFYAITLLFLLVALLSAFF